MTPFAEAFSLQGETALITGGATGLGRAMAEAFLAAGAKVVIAGRRKHPLEVAVAELGPNADYVIYDVSQTDRVAALRDELRERFGGITVLVNNAGQHIKKSIEETEEAEFRELMDTHVTGSFVLSKMMAPLMAERGHGSILFTASMTSFFGLPRVFAYSTAKSAYLGMVRSMAVDLGPKGIRVNAIAPGFIETEISRKAFAGDPGRKAKVISRTPMGRFGTPEDVGWAAVYLASPAARFLNGVVLPVDGGVLIGF